MKLEARSMIQDDFPYPEVALVVGKYLSRVEASAAVSPTETAWSEAKGADIYSNTAQSVFSHLKRGT